jgi:hypothetical protein
VNRLKGFADSLRGHRKIDRVSSETGDTGPIHTNPGSLRFRSVLLDPLLYSRLSAGNIALCQV